MAEVILEHVMKIYPGDVTAVNDANLQITDGQFVVLVGPSGCGKSTTLRMVAGLEDITEGNIYIGDRVVNEVMPKDRDIAMVFQDYALYPHMDVYKNMAFGLKLRKYPKAEIEQRVQDAAKILGLESLLHRKPRELSGGQRQRVAVGRAIVRQPKVFLFDEPLSNLDAKLRVEMRAELKQLHRRLCTTTIYVTHDQEEAMTLGDTVVVMKDGVIQQVGAPLDVYAQPVNRFVAGFLGMPPMNFLPGQLRESGAQTIFFDGNVSINLSAQQATKVSAWIEKDVVLGIRPEAMTLATDASQPGAELPVQIRVMEPLGERMDIYCFTPQQPKIIARIEAHRGLQDGQNILLHVDTERIHLFEPGEMGKNLLVDAVSIDEEVLVAS